MTGPGGDGGGGTRGCHRTAEPPRHRSGRPHSSGTPAAAPARTYEFGLPAVRCLLGAPGAPGPRRALPTEPLVLPPAATRWRGRGTVTRPRRLHGHARARNGDGQGGALPAIGPRPGGPGRAGRLRLARLSWARPGRAPRGEERGSALKPQPHRSAGFSEEKPLIPPRPSRAGPRAPNGRGWRSPARPAVRTVDRKSVV